MKWLALALALALLVVSGCVVTPVTPIPTPSPEYHVLPYPAPEDAPSVRDIPPGLDPDRTIHRIYLPLLASQRTPSRLGWEAASDGQALAARAALLSLAPGTVRTGIPWKDVEPVRGGGYVWSASKDAHINLLAEGGNRIIAILNWPPQFAIVTPGCSPVAPEYYIDWLAYVRAVVRRYGDRVDVWEVWNEEDFPISPNDQGHGCWGNSRLADFGGKNYGQFVSMTAKAIRTIQPDATIISGGLLLGCTATGEDGSCVGDGLRFFEAALPWMKDDIDGVGFHNYEFWYFRTPTGTPQLDSKVLALRKLTDLPLWMSESGYLCHRFTDQFLCASDAYEQAQAAYVGLWAASCRRLGLESCVYYSISYNGWQHADLSGPGGVKRAGYWRLAEELRK